MRLRPDSSSVSDPWKPDVLGADAPWDLRQDVHLHRRAGFAAT
jgi:hypothetical protein